MLESKGFQLRMHGIGQPWTSKWHIPVTRIPQGDATLTGKPSLLTYAVASKGLVLDERIEWNKAPADHAFVFIRANVVFRAYQTKTSWKSHPKNLA